MPTSNNRPQFWADSTGYSPPTALQRHIVERTVDVGSDAERLARANKRARGVCPECGRPFIHASLSDGFALLACSSGHVSRAEKRSRLYSRAKTLRASPR